MHPGRDDDYTYSRDYTIGNDVVGAIQYTSDEMYTGNVEGKDYILYPFIGYFHPTQDNIPEGVASISIYQPLIGAAVVRSRYLGSLAYIEDRLVYYDLI